MQKTEAEKESLTFGSLFAGIGGFDLGFERAGLKCKWQVEIDDYATRVLEKNWPQVHRERDIKTCGKHNLEYVDVICGGFPCQDISYAGRGAGLDGERSGLFFEAIRLVQELRPRAVVLENVSALLTRGLERVLGSLAEIGYDAEWHCIPASYVGAPHIRDRIWIIAYREGAISNTDSDGLSNNRIFLLQPAQSCQKSGLYSRWAVEPAVGRVANGIPKRVDRLRCLGNAVVPQVAELVAIRTIEILQEQSGISVKP